MKKVILSVLFVGGLSAMVQAQLLEPGISIGYGGFTPPILSGSVNTRIQYFTNGAQGNTTNTSTGAFHLALTAKVWKIRVGVVGSYEVITTTSNYSYEAGNYPVPAETKANSRYWTGMAVMQWNYWHFLGFHLYGGLAAGVYGVTTVLKSNTSNQSPSGQTTGSGFAYQITPVGLSLGPNKFSVFAEAGYGYLGIIDAGVRFKL
jgi:hypothetical protein